MNRIAAYLLYAYLFLAVAATAADSATWYVTPSGTGAAATIQAAIDSSANTDTVMLAPGVFDGPGNYNIDFKGKAILVTSQSGADLTVIDCQSIGGGLIFQSGEGPASVLSGVTVTNGVVALAQFAPPETRSAEELIALGPAAVFGGGVNIVNGSPTIRGNVFRNCSATVGGGVYAGPGAALIEDNIFDSCSASYGGGIFYSPSADITIRENTFTSCSATNGGGIYGASGSAGVIEWNTVESCHATHQGGGVFCATGTTPLVADNDILGNAADNDYLEGSGSGIFCDSGSAPEIVRNLFSANTLGYLGRGGGLALHEASGVVSSNTFIGNTGPATIDYDSEGGGLYCRKCSATIENNVFESNIAGSGSGMSMSLDNPDSPSVRSNEFYSNTAYLGGGLHISVLGDTDSMRVDDCTFEANTALGSGGGAVGGGVDFWNCVFRNNRAASAGGGIAGLKSIRYCVFVGNSAATGGGVQTDGFVDHCTFTDNSATDGAGIYTFMWAWIQNSIITFSARGAAFGCYDTLMQVYRCNIYGNAGGDSICGRDRGGNFSEDPLFCDRPGGNFMLAADSPCAPAHTPYGAQIGAFGVGCGPVPVVFGAIEARASAHSVQLTWQSIADESFAGFDIYRAGVRINPRRLDPLARSFVDEDIEPSTDYGYRVAAVYHDGTGISSRTVTVTTDPGELALSQNHPNPFNPSTTISFTLPSRMRVTLEVFDVAGRRVASLVSEVRGGGHHEVTWNGRNDDGNAMHSGVYFARLEAGGRVLTKKMILLK
jgi:hypothetical protein